MASDAERGGPRRLEIELTPVCDHRCVHCYNVWNARPGDAQHGLAPRVERDLGQVRALIDRVAEQGVEHLSLTGGEPLLHPEALAIVEHACAKVSSVSLITNGSHVSDAVAQRLGEAGLRSAQLTLLGGRREVHDPLKGVESFDDTLRSALRLRDAGVRVNACYVASQRNAGQLPGVLELCFALGIRSLSYNRMSAAGLGVHRIAALLPSPEQIEADLRACETLARRWEIRVSTAMPIPPCLVRWERYPWVRFGVCSSGSGQHNLVMDLEGRLRAGGRALPRPLPGQPAPHVPGLPPRTELRGRLQGERLRGLRQPRGPGPHGLVGPEPRGARAPRAAGAAGSGGARWVNPPCC